MCGNPVLCLALLKGGLFALLMTGFFVFLCVAFVDVLRRALSTGANNSLLELLELLDLDNDCPCRMVSRGGAGSRGSRGSLNSSMAPPRACGGDAVRRCRRCGEEEEKEEEEEEKEEADCKRCRS